MICIDKNADTNAKHMIQKPMLHLEQNKIHFSDYANSSKIHFIQVLYKMQCNWSLSTSTFNNNHNMFNLYSALPELKDALE